MQHQTVTDKTIKFFYDKWQHLGSRSRAAAGEKERFWGADRPGYRSDYIDESSGREDEQ